MSLRRCETAAACSSQPPTQVGFSTTSGIVASPATSVAGVATTTLAAPAAGVATTAVITATSAGLTGQTIVQLGACAVAATNTNTTPAAPYVPYFPPYYPPVQQPYYPPVAPYVQQPVVQPQQPVVNVTVNIPPNAFPQPAVAAPSTAGQPVSAVRGRPYRRRHSDHRTRADGGLKALAE